MKYLSSDLAKIRHISIHPILVGTITKYLLSTVCVTKSFNGAKAKVRFNFHLYWFLKVFFFVPNRNLKSRSRPWLWRPIDDSVDYGEHKTTFGNSLSACGLASGYELRNFIRCRTSRKNFEKGTRFYGSVFQPVAGSTTIVVGTRKTHRWYAGRFSFYKIKLKYRWK